MLLRRRPLLFGGLALFALRPAVALASPPEVFGRFRYAGGQKQRDRFEAAVEDVVSQLNIVIRSLARKKITESQAPSRHLEITQVQDMVSIQRDGAPEIRGRADGKPFDWKNRYGDALRVKLTLRDDRLSVYFEGSSSRTTTTYRIDDAGRRLTMRTVIKDPRLPKPLDLAFSYGRLGADSE